MSDRDTRAIDLEQARAARRNAERLASSMPAAGAVGLTRSSGSYEIVVYRREGVLSDPPLPARIDGVPLVIRPSAGHIVARTPAA